MLGLLGAIASGVLSLVDSNNKRSAARSARNAQLLSSNRARGTLGEGYEESRRYLNSAGKRFKYGDKQSKLDLQTGLNGGLRYIDDAESRITDGRDQSETAINRGLDEARSQYDTAVARYNPYAKQGKQALDMYMDAINGGGASILNNPIFKAQQDEMNKQIAAQMAMTGRGGSMKSIESTFAPAQQQLMRSAYSDYFNQLNPIMTMGYNASASQAGLDSRFGDTYLQGQNALSNLYQNTANQLAGLDNTRSNMVLENSRNLANLSQNTARNLASIDGNLANLATAHYGNLANLDLGKGTIDTNYYNNVANANSGFLSDIGMLLASNY